MRKELSDKKIQTGWEQTFSTNNPFCPCDLKSFTKAVRWAERVLTASAPVSARQPSAWVTRGDALQYYREWLDATGAMPKAGSWAEECEQIVADAFDAGRSAAAKPAEPTQGDAHADQA